MESNPPSSSPESSPQLDPNAVISTNLLREKIRNYTKTNREQIRATNSDSLRFGVGEIKARIQELENLTEKDVSGLSSRIKRRKHATVEDMYRLSHSFLQDVKNIEIFIKITGALQVLIKELTGRDVERQKSAAECICNLSLGEGPVCEKIASLAGSYLVTYLHSTESQLVRLCLWTMANILSTGQKSCALTLMKMQVLPQLWKLYCDDEVADPVVDYREDSGICLQLIALNANHLLTPENRAFVMENMADKNPTSVAGEYHLQIVFLVLFSQPEMVASLSPPDSLYLVNYALININSTNDFITSAQCLKIIFAIRILSNLLISQPLLYSTLLLQVSCVWSSNLIAVFNKLFAFHNHNLTQEALWFLKNVLRLEEQDAFMSPNILEKIRIFKDDMPNIDNEVVEGAMAMAV